MTWKEQRLILEKQTKQFPEMLLNSLDAAYLGGLEEMKKDRKKYWFYAGKWHKALCPFILRDEGVCNCKIK